MTNFLVTISAFQKTASITKHALDSALWVLLLNKDLEVINYGLEDSGRYSQNHLHLIIRSHGYSKYTTKIGPFHIDWKVLRTQIDLHRAQLYVTKEQYRTTAFL